MDHAFYCTENSLYNLSRCYSKIEKVCHPEILDTHSDLALAGIFPLDVEMSREHRLIRKPYVEPQNNNTESFLCFISFFHLNLPIPTASGRIKQRTILYVTENDIVSEVSIR